MRKAINPNKAKIHRNYTVEEIADLFGVHKNTVRAWVKSGLSVCDERKPLLILGSTLRVFLKEKKTRTKQQCQPWEFYCLRCRKPQTPAGNMADYEAISASTGRLIALCPACEGVINKYTSHAKLVTIVEKLDVSLPSDLQRISKRGYSLLNCDFK